MAGQTGLSPESEQVVQSLVAQHGQALGVAARDRLTSVLRTVCERLTIKAQLCNAAALTRTVCSDDASLPPVAVDEELTTLQTEVQKAHAAVLKRRQAVPERITDDMRQLLEGVRPPADASPLPGDAAEEDAASGVLLSPAPQQLHAQLANTLPDLPELRARLNEAVCRLGRVVDAAAPAVQPEAASSAAQPAKQVTGCKRPAVSPAFEEAVRSGNIATRRRLRDRLSDSAQRNLAMEIAAQ